MNFASLKKAPAKSKKEQPLLDAPGLAEVVDQGIEAAQNKDAWTSQLEVTNAQLKSKALSVAWPLFHGHSNVEDTFKVVGRKGTVLVSMKNTYKLPEDLAPVRALLGEHADRYIQKSFTVEVDCDAIPVQYQQSFIDTLVASVRGLEEMLGVEEGALLNAVSYKERTGLAKSFHDERHKLFTPEENQRIHEVLPCTLSCKYDY